MGNKTGLAMYRMVRDVVDAVLQNSMQDSPDDTEFVDVVLDAVADSIAEFSTALAAGDMAVFDSIAADNLQRLEQAFDAERHFVTHHCADCGEPLGDIDVTLEEDGVTPSEPSGDKEVKN